MTNEQIIKGLTKMLDDTIEANECGLSNNDFKDDIELLKSALSLIKEQEEEIAKYEKIYKEYDCYRWVKELNKKDKQIDLMAEYISKRDVEEDICMKNRINADLCNEDYTNCKNCIKQYFERKVEEC